MTDYNLKHLKVEYKVIKQEVCERFDKEIEKLANSLGLEFWGSGFDFKTQVRDLEFGSKLKELKKSAKKE